MSVINAEYLDYVDDRVLGHLSVAELYALQQQLSAQAELVAMRQKKLSSALAHRHRTWLRRVCQHPRALPEYVAESEFDVWCDPNPEREWNQTMLRGLVRRGEDLPLSVCDKHVARLGAGAWAKLQRAERITGFNPRWRILPSGVTRVAQHIRDN